MMRVLLRADGGVRIGTGHVMRCLALADELRARGCESSFAMRAMKGHLIAEVSARGYPVIELDAGEEPDEGDLAPWLARQRDGKRQAADAAQTLAVLSPGHTWDWLVVDHYALGAAWQAPMRAAARHVLAIDDLADREHDCDVLLDQNPQREGRYAGRVASQALLLLGPAHALLRAEFQVARQKLHRQPPQGRQLHAFVSFGGADEQGVALDAVAALGQAGFAAGQAVVVAGGRNPHLPALQAACERLAYQCIASTDRMAELMSAADLCIGAGGTSMIERFALALPGIVVPIADNQRPGALAASGQGAIELVDAEPSARVAAIAGVLRDLVTQPGRLERMGQAAGLLCDARGAVRVAAVLQRQALALVPAAPSDAQRLFEWRNAPETRRHSGAGEEIGLEHHLRWFDGVLRDPARRIWIAQLGGAPVGVVRFDTQEQEQGLAAVISVYRVPGGQGRGWGSALIAAGAAEAHRAWPGLVRVDARISPDNQASLRAFAACGFAPGPEPDLHHLFLRSASP